MNGLPTDALLDIQNNEPDPVGIQAVTGALWTPDFGGANPPRVFRNLTTILYQVELASGGKQSLNYRFSTEMHPAELVLRLVAAVVDSQGHAYSVPAYEGTVSVVEKPTSIFDPQMYDSEVSVFNLLLLLTSLYSIFLYVILAAGFAGTAYFVYNTWISTLFPQTKRKGGKGGERARTSTKGTKKVDPSDQVAVAGADGPAVTSGSRAYDESWIPQHHINRPEAKRVRSGTPSGVKTKKAS